MSVDKRYQVFVSSTFSDLKDERKEVMQALLELDCIPAGMELFPAADDAQWSLIQGVIDDCDYYIVIIAGRYGSVGPDGKSYTEMEYRYAMEKNKPVLAFLHENPGALPQSMCEDTTEGRSKLDAFRTLAKEKHCKFWTSASDLGSKISRALVNTIKNKPAIGWVRGNLVPSATATEELLRLRTRIDELESQLAASSTGAPKDTADLAQGDDTFLLHTYFMATDSKRGEINSDPTYQVSWNELFAEISPTMIDEISDDVLRQAISSLARKKCSESLKLSHPGNQISYCSIAEEDFNTIKIQLRALGLITEHKYGRGQNSSVLWSLTPYGDAVMTKLRAIRKPAIGRVPKSKEDEEP
jgi:hypothetical protein